MHTARELGHPCQGTSDSSGLSERQIAWHVSDLAERGMDINEHVVVDEMCEQVSSGNLFTSEYTTTTALLAGDDASCTARPPGERA